MFDKLMKLLKIQVDDTSFEDKPISNVKQFSGIILEKRDNELIIGSETDKSLKMRVLIIEKQFIPNMVYPSLCDEQHCAISYKQISLRDRVLIEFDNMLRKDELIPINSHNNLLTIMDLDIKKRGL